MSKCFSFTQVKNSCHISTFKKLGFQSSTTDLKNGTVMHCWVPKSPNVSKPNLLLIHGLGANAMWQFDGVIQHFIHFFNVYVPDLVFFGESYTSQPDRTEGFQAECVMRVMEAHSVKKLSLVGLSYGGFVGYCIAAEYREVVERVVICSSGICMEEKDLAEVLFTISDLEEAASILVPLKPKKLRELIGYSFYKPPPVGLIPDCFFIDFIDEMCRDYVEQKKELIRAVPKDRKLSSIPKITQPTLIIWGEHDRIFPLELGYRLKRHLGDNAHLAVIKNAGHAINMENKKEYMKLLKSFLIDLKLPQETSQLKIYSTVDDLIGGGNLGIKIGDENINLTRKAAC